MAESKSNKGILTLIPKDKTFKNSKIYNDLNSIKGIHLDMVKGLIFVSHSGEKSKKEAAKYLENNTHLYRFTDESKKMFYGNKKLKRKKALIIVDVQPIFLNKNNKHILSNIAERINTIPYDLYVNAVFYADKDSIWKKQTGWSVPKKEAKTESSIKKLLDKKENVINVNKQTKSVFKGHAGFETFRYFKVENDLCDVKGVLHHNDIEEVHIIGLDTNDCVLATAYEAFDLGFFTYVIEECTQSSEGNEIHGKAIDLLRHVGLTNK
jgi:nicotinamidase-related amidase